MKGGSMAISPDGRTLAVFGGKMLYVWFADPSVPNARPD
jgi:hypothetical protein